MKIHEQNVNEIRYENRTNIYKIIYTKERRRLFSVCFLLFYIKNLSFHADSVQLCNVLFLKKEEEEEEEEASQVTID